MSCVWRDLGAWELCGNHIGLPLAHLRVMGNNTDQKQQGSCSLTTQQISPMVLLCFHPQCFLVYIMTATQCYVFLVIKWMNEFIHSSPKPHISTWRSGISGKIRHANGAHTLLRLCLVCHDVFHVRFYKNLSMPWNNYNVAMYVRTITWSEQYVP